LTPRFAHTFANFPEKRLARWARQLQPNHFLKLENDLRGNRSQVITTGDQVVGGSVLLIGIYFTWANLVTTQQGQAENLKATREGQITDRLIKPWKSTFNRPLNES
jgi:hypothetical protein